MLRKIHPLHWLLVAFYYLLYHPMAWTYDWVANFVSAGLWPEWILQGIPFIHGEKILEIGHGTGHLQIELLQKGYQTTGLDSSHEMGLVARKNLSTDFKYHGGYAHFPNLVRGQTQSLPFQSSSFDSILSSFPTEYIADPGTIAETYRVLVPGGCLVVILSAWIIGNTLPQRLAAFLFRVTKQAPSWNPSWVIPFETCGFIMDVHENTLRSSKVLIIVASKPQDS